jgi:hypothetical protein
MSFSATQKETNQTRKLRATSVRTFSASVSGSPATRSTEADETLHAPSRNNNSTMRTPEQPEPFTPHLPTTTGGGIVACVRKPRESRYGPYG